MTTPALLLCLLLPAQGRSCLNQTYRVQAARAQSYTTYAQTYAQPVQYQIQERVIWVPVEGGSNGYPDSAYSAADLVGSRQRSQAIAAGRLSFQQAVIDRLDKLEGIRAELAKANQNAGDPGPPIPPSGPPVVPPTQPPTNPPVGPGQPPPPPDPNAPKKPIITEETARQWTADAVAVMAKKCAKCHTAEANPRKGFVIFDKAGNLALQSPGSYDMIRGATETLFMPPGSDKLNDLEQSQIKNWGNLHREEINDFVKSLVASKAPAAVRPLPNPLPRFPSAEAEAEFLRSYGYVQTPNGPQPIAAPLPASAPPPPIVPGAIRQ